MTSEQPTNSEPAASRPGAGPGPGPGPSPSPSSSSTAGRDPSRSWIPPIPSPLQRLFNSVPLVTYPPNELPRRSPAPGGLPTLHVFISDEGAARGAPSFNPSCLKWQTYLRIASVPHNLVPSTNHASPTGSLPFLQPALPGAPELRLDARHLLPVPSSRLDSYARQHGSLPTTTTATAAAAASQTPDQRYRRQQAYQSLLDHPVRNAWLYALYLAPANEAVLRHLYVDPVSRSGPVRRTLLQQLRAAARAEVARGPGATAATTTTTTAHGWSLAGNVGDLLAWALGGRVAVDPGRVYEEARRAFEALETLLGEHGTEGGGEKGEEEDGRWFFGAARPTLFDAAVFSYTYLILHDDYSPDVPWGDDTLRSMLRDCPRLVAHAERILKTYWGPQEDKAATS